MRRSRLKIILLYFTSQFSVYTEFGVDPYVINVLMWLMAQLVLYVARIFSRHIPFQKSYRLYVAVEAEAGKGLDAGHAGV